MFMSNSGKESIRTNQSFKNLKPSDDFHDFYIKSLNKLNAKELSFTRKKSSRKRTARKTRKSSRKRTARKMKKSSRK